MKTKFSFFPKSRAYFTITIIIINLLYYDFYYYFRFRAITIPHSKFTFHSNYYSISHLFHLHLPHSLIRWSLTKTCFHLLHSGASHHFYYPLGPSAILKYYYAVLKLWFQEYSQYCPFYAVINHCPFFMTKDCFFYFMTMTKCFFPVALISRHCQCRPTLPFPFLLPSLLQLLRPSRFSELFCTIYFYLFPWSRYIGTLVFSA